MLYLHYQHEQCFVDIQLKMIYVFIENNKEIENDFYKNMVKVYYFTQAANGDHYNSLHMKLGGINNTGVL